MILESIVSIIYDFDLAVNQQYLMAKKEILVQSITKLIVLLS